MTHKIFVSGDKWATRRQPSHRWTPFDISDKNFDGLVSGKKFLNPEKSTSKALYFSDKMTERKSLLVSIKKREGERSKWTEVFFDLVLENYSEISEKQERELNFLQKYFDRNKQFPDDDTLSEKFPGAVEFLTARIAAGDIEAIPALLTIEDFYKSL